MVRVRVGLGLGLGLGEYTTRELAFTRQLFNRYVIVI